MSKTITALFKERDTAEIAVTKLLDAGVARNDISLMMSRETRGRFFGIEEHTKAAEGVAAGATAGGILGAIAAGLAAVGSIAAPGVGLLAAGPIVAALTGAGAGGATGGLVGGLVGLGIKEHEAKLYADEMKKGGILVGVEAHEDRASRVRDILKNAGATSVS